MPLKPVNHNSAPQDQCYMCRENFQTDNSKLEGILSHSHPDPVQPNIHPLHAVCAQGLFTNKSNALIAQIRTKSLDFGIHNPWPDFDNTVTCGICKVPISLPPSLTSSSSSSQENRWSVGAKVLGKLITAVSSQAMIGPLVDALCQEVVVKRFNVDPSVKNSPLLTAVKIAGRMLMYSFVTSGFLRNTVNDYMRLTSSPEQANSILERLTRWKWSLPVTLASLAAAKVVVSYGLIHNSQAAKLDNDFLKELFVGVMGWGPLLLEWQMNIRSPFNEFYHEFINDFPNPLYKDQLTRFMLSITSDSFEELAKDISQKKSHRLEEYKYQLECILEASEMFRPYVRHLADDERGVPTDDVMKLLKEIFIANWNSICQKAFETQELDFTEEIIKHLQPTAQAAAAT